MLCAIGSGEAGRPSFSGVGAPVSGAGAAAPEGPDTAPCAHETAGDRPIKPMPPKNVVTASVRTKGQGRSRITTRQLPDESGGPAAALNIDAACHRSIPSNRPRPVHVLAMPGPESEFTATRRSARVSFCTLFGAEF